MSGVPGYKSSVSARRDCAQATCLLTHPIGFTTFESVCAAGRGDATQGPCIQERLEKASWGTCPYKQGRRITALVTAISSSCGNCETVRIGASNANPGSRHDIPSLGMKTAATFVNMVHLERRSVFDASGPGSASVSGE